MTKNIIHYSLYIIHYHQIGITLEAWGRIELPYAVLPTFAKASAGKQTSYGGVAGICTRVRGFADHCLTTRPQRQ